MPKPPKPARKPIPLSVKVDACLYLLGLDPADVEWHHDPALGRRDLLEDGSDWKPAQLDYRFIRPMSKGAHKKQTFGTKDRRRDSDLGEIRHEGLVSKGERGHLERMAKKGKLVVPPPRRVR